MTDKIIDFLRTIGIEVHEVDALSQSVLPGVEISNGALHIDRSALTYPSDLLHEAGHLAVQLPEQRNGLFGDLPDEDPSKKMGDEIAAIAWSYAAALHLGIAASDLFHSGGYQGQSEWFTLQYTSGNYIGLPLLQWMGLCYDPVNATRNNREAYPRMIRWLRQAAA